VQSNRRRNRTGFVLVAVLSAALFVLPALVAAAPPGEPITAIEQEVVDLVNAERAKVGAAPLTVNYSLMAAAWSHNEHMFNTGCFSHTACGNGNPGDRIRATGYQSMGWGENIAKGQQTPAAVMQAWMNSSGHRANILNRNFRDIGVAHHDGSWPNGPLWTQVFASPRDGYATVTPPAGSGGGGGSPTQDPGVPPPTVCSVAMDFDQSKVVDMADVNIISAAFMATPGDPRWNESFDVMSDGVVDIHDIFQVVLSIGDRCQS
jgi:uncharacterized protein YkwD